MKKVLLVEDNETNRDMLSRRLIKRGFDVSTAIDGLEAVQKAQEILPHLILMDISLPEIDGLEATRRIQDMDSTRNIPVIALTAHAQSTDRQDALDAGCRDFDTKPVDIKRLLSKMESVLDP